MENSLKDLEHKPVLRKRTTILMLSGCVSYHQKPLAITL